MLWVRGWPPRPSASFGKMIYLSPHCRQKLHYGLFSNAPVYKNKGSSDDFTKYRFICLLSHASKVISVCLLRRLVHETDWYLPVHQAGFRQNRGTRDNIYILAQIMDALIVWHQYANLVFSIHWDFKRLHDLLGRI